MEVEPFKIENKDEFIEENKKFIYGVSCKLCNRKLDWSNDDELSLALIAFNNACDTYNNEKGNFFSFAKVLIRNALIDHFRTANRNPYIMFKEEDKASNYIDKKGSLVEFEKEKENGIRAEEIAMLSEELSKYKIGIKDLLKASPSHIDTRNTLLKLAFRCSREEHLVEYIINKGKLPVKEMMLVTNSKRKYIEKWRRYILVLVLIFSSNEYPFIKSFLNIKVGEYDE